jgi:hypothetical protein
MLPLVKGVPGDPGAVRAAGSANGFRLSLSQLPEIFHRHLHKKIPGLRFCLFFLIFENRSEHLLPQEFFTG